MKRVDMSLVELVHAGEAWTHPRPPCCKRMIQHLERNEEIVTWVQVGVFWAVCVRGGTDASLASPSRGRCKTSFP